jgi:hypothetical protein
MQAPFQRLTDMASAIKTRVTKVIIVFGLLFTITVLSIPEGTLAGQDEHWVVRWGDSPYIYPKTPVSQPFIYQNSTFDIALNYGQPKNWTQFSSFYYSLNQTGNHPLNCHKHTEYDHYNYSLSATLENLANGNYTLNVYTDYVNGTSGSIWDTNFTVDTTFPTPIITVISPLNQTYHTGKIEVAYSVDSPTIMAYYSIDKPGDRPSNYTTFNGSRSLTVANLSDGTYKVSFWIRTEAGEHIYIDAPYAPIETVYFTIDTAPTSPYFVIIFAAIVAVGAITLFLVMRFMRKNSSSATEAAAML